MRINIAKNCDYSEKEEIPTTGHNLVTAEAKTPTCSSAGWSAYLYCSNPGCNYSEKKEIPIIDHTVEKGKCKNCDFTVKKTVDFYVEVPTGRKVSSGGSWREATDDGSSIWNSNIYI